jgi:hypothetical protein
LRKQATAYHLQRQNHNDNNNSSWYRGPNIKSNERNLSRRGNHSHNLPYTAATNKVNSEQEPPVGTNPQAVPASPASSSSIQLDKSVEFGSLGPVVLEGSSYVCKSYGSTITDKEDKKQAPEGSFKWSRKVSLMAPSESSQISTCQEIVNTLVEDFPWSMKGSLKVQQSSSLTSTSNSQEKVNLPLMEVPSPCSKENVKVSEAPHPCKETVKVNAKKAWSHTHQGDCKVLPDLHHRSWAEVSKR